MRTRDYKESISADYNSGGSSDTAFRGREEVRWGNATEKIHGEFIDQLDFDALQNFYEEEPAHRLRLSLQDFLQVIILGAILTGMGFLIAWL